MYNKWCIFCIFIIDIEKYNPRNYYTEEEYKVLASRLKAERKAWLKSRWMGRNMPEAQRAGLAKWYSPEKAASFKFAESFEITEYGAQPTEADIRRLFPMLAK